MTHASDNDYRARLVDLLLDRFGDQLPVFLIVGPRAAGKTYTASRRAATVIRLDSPAQAAAFEADPDAALRNLPEPVLLDEWQVVPGVLGAVKRTVDSPGRSGARFFITGSVRSDLDEELWPGTGRLLRISLYGMTLREQLGRTGQRSIFDVLVDGVDLSPAEDSPDLRGYVDLARRGGFPVPALQLDDSAARDAWLESYIEQLLTHDVAQIDERDPVRLRRFFDACAINSAGTVDVTTLATAAGINHRTADAYTSLLRDLLVLDEVPAYFSNRVKRLVKRRKLYVVDPALITAALRMDSSGVLLDGALLGRVVDTFVAAQLRAETAVANSRPRLYHLRQEGGRREVDLVAELAGGRIIGIEVKASSAPSKQDARHLLWLRDELGNDFVRGVVFHTGPATFELDDRIIAAPISSIWARRA